MTCFNCGGSGVRCCEFGADHRAQDEAVGRGARHTALLEHAKSIEARVRAGEKDAELVHEARAARAAALELERHA